MARIVVVTTTELADEALADHVAPDDELFIVVPAVEQSRLQWLANDEGDARAHAEAVGASVAGEAPPTAPEVEVTPELPSQAVLDAIATHAPDEILVVLRDGEDATWLEEGELGALAGESVGVPITRVRI